MPMNARVRISIVGGRANADCGGSDGEDREADGQRTLASEPVAEAAGGEEQAREDERVAVDDPLQLAGRAPRSLINDGIATLSTVLSMPMISKLRHITASAHQRRA